MPTEIRTGDELAALLGTLGDTADEVANKLEKLGIRGVLNESDTCAVANWLKAEITDAYDVSVSGSLVALNEDIECSTPRAVEVFIDRFDHEWYPALVQEG